MADELNAPEKVQDGNGEGESCAELAGQPANLYKTVILEYQPVELYKILKFEGLADSGAQAKHFIDEGLVTVNGLIELRRRRKIVADDLIQLGEDTLKMVVSSGE